MKDRRKAERRKWGPAPKYPFLDSDGVLVTHNRRRVIDRRLTSIELEDDANQTARSLRLSVKDNTRELSEDSRKLVVGRGSQCDIRIKAKFASRVHAVFEYRDGAFVVIDESTNGTFLATDQGDNVHLVGEEMTLSGTGYISLGAPVDHDDKEIIRFSCS